MTFAFRLIVHSFQIDLINSSSGLDWIGPAWSALALQSSRTTPFQLPQWLVPWWNHFGGNELLIVTVREEGQLVGLAPFYVIRSEDGLKRLYFLGTGISDYLDVLTVDGRDQEIAAAILGYLASSQEWQICDLQELRPESPLLNVPVPSGLRAQRSDCSPCAYLELPPDPGLLMSALPYRPRKNLRRDTKRTGE